MKKAITIIQVFVYGNYAVGNDLILTFLSRPFT